MFLKLSPLPRLASATRTRHNSHLHDYRRRAKPESTTVSGREDDIHHFFIIIIFIIVGGFCRRFRLLFLLLFSLNPSDRKEDRKDQVVRPLVQRGFRGFRRGRRHTVLTLADDGGGAFEPPSRSNASSSSNISTAFKETPPPFTAVMLLLLLLLDTSAVRNCFVARLVPEGEAFVTSPKTVLVLEFLSFINFFEEADESFFFSLFNAPILLYIVYTCV